MEHRACLIAGSGSSIADSMPSIAYKFPLCLESNPKNVIGTQGLHKWTDLNGAKIRRVIDQASPAG
jgi:hypothetical protein